MAPWTPATDRNSRVVTSWYFHPCKLFICSYPPGMAAGKSPQCCIPPVEHDSYQNLRYMATCYLENKVMIWLHRTTKTKNHIYSYLFKLILGSFDLEMLLEVDSSMTHSRTQQQHHQFWRPHQCGKHQSWEQQWQHILFKNTYIYICIYSHIHIQCTHVQYVYRQIKPYIYILNMHICWNKHVNVYIYVK